MILVIGPYLYSPGEVVNLASFRGYGKVGRQAIYPLFELGESEIIFYIRFNSI